MLTLTSCVRSLVVPLLCISLLPTSFAAAALDPETDKPYRYQVVLHVAPHRLLTKVFRDQLENELRDSLQAGLGGLAVVEVVRQHPRLPEVLDKGLTTLDSWKDLSDSKTHFVLIDYVAGGYEIQARQHDGLTGQASAVIRRQRERDRQFVARTAALLIGEDFGPVGTIEKREGNKVQLALKGGKLAEPLVKKGEVFCIVRIAQGPQGLWGRRVLYAALQVQKDPADGGCECQLFAGLPSLMEAGDAAGFRCLKLSTIKGPLRIRLVKHGSPGIPEPVREVHIRRHGFDGEENTRIPGVTDNDGFFSTERTVDPESGLFDHLAFVNVVTREGTVRARVPVPIVDDRTVTIPVLIQGEAGLQLIVRRNSWERQVFDSLEVVAALFNDLDRQLRKPDERTQALEKAHTALLNLGDDVARYQDQHKKLAEDARTLPAGTTLDLTRGDQWLKTLASGRDKLMTVITRTEEAIKKENSPEMQELRAKVSQAQLHEEKADIDKAIALYEEAAAKLKDSDVSQHLDALKKAWEPKNDEHRAKRKFVYEDWPAADLIREPKAIKEARSALSVCTKHADRFTVSKLLIGSVAHTAKLKERSDALNPDVNDDDRNTAKAIAEASEELSRLLTDIERFLKDGQTGK